ncbi:HNH endonuclease family protein [Ensifer adhaerens]|uniref:HNH endonuclease family protein n=1 Tax=Ensifer adhaerens TaxID=106592 RepID=UPI001929A171
MTEFEVFQRRCGQHIAYEHIIPRRINTKKSREEFGAWSIYLGEKARTQHPKLVHRIGNLTLFAGTLNIVASNNGFGMKKEGYKASSILLTKELELPWGSHPEREWGWISLYNRATEHPRD